jgi:8-amino-7-oxononanoate synthase
MELPQSFIRSLKAGLEKRQQENQYFHLHPPAMELGLVDFGSNDSLSIRNSGCVRERFLDELDATPDFALGAGGSRVLDGSNGHVMKLERYLADYHGAEDGLFFNSGYEANVAIHSNLPQPGDVIIHDSLIHTSIRDGIRGSRASIVKSFAHNDVDSLGHVVDEIKKTSPVIAQGHQTVFVVFESFYSMEGDMSPVADILSRVRELLPFGNCAFIIDEAHSTGLIGPQGSGYINHLKLQDEGIIQMHSYAKAPGAHGGMLLSRDLSFDAITFQLIFLCVLL